MGGVFKDACVALADIELAVIVADSVPFGRLGKPGLCSVVGELCVIVVISMPKPTGFGDRIVGWWGLRAVEAGMSVNRQKDGGLQSRIQIKIEIIMKLISQGCKEESCQWVNSC